MEKQRIEEEKYNPQEQQNELQKTVRFVCLSDTHNKHFDIKVPDGDVLIHAGDFSGIGSEQEIKIFEEFLKKQPHKHKVVIAGNHDLCFDLENFTQLTSTFKGFFDKPQKIENWKELKNSITSICTYLENEVVELYGYKIYGSPFSPNFYDWAFMKEIPDLKPVWDNIPTDTDILVTHGPPFEILDKCVSGHFAGCPELRKQVLERIKPKYHIFGHIHEAYGKQTIGETTFINASNVDYNYLPNHQAFVFDLPKLQDN